MEPDLRAITPKLLPAYQQTDARGFAAPFERGPDDPWSNLDLDRAIGAFDDEEIVAIGRNYALETTMPGGVLLPAAGVSWISVLPTHRRRGILRAMMDRLLLDACEHEEAALILTASEGGIYGRFGYGIATHVLGIEIERRRVKWRTPAPGRIRFVSPEEARGIAPVIFEQVRRTRPGVVSRPDAWWEGEWWDTRDRAPRFDVVFEGDSGPEGFALYGVDGSWSEGESTKTLYVRDLVAATPEAAAGLWQFLGNIDLIRTIRAWNVPTDTELPWLLSDSRAMKVTSRRDFLWLRPVDVPTLLSSRTYAVDGRLVLEVADDGPAAGRYELDGGPDGATCTRTHAEPHLVLGADALGMIALGGIRPSVLRRAGRIHAPEVDAPTFADVMLATDRKPVALTWF
ncbi:MAG: GNAT family N-acetyltransferase [Acidimicrobiia bacterium]